MSGIPEKDDELIDDDVDTTIPAARAVAVEGETDPPASEQDAESTQTEEPIEEIDEIDELEIPEGTSEDEPDPEKPAESDELQAAEAEGSVESPQAPPPPPSSPSTDETSIAAPAGKTDEAAEDETATASILGFRARRHWVPLAAAMAGVGAVAALVIFLLTSGAFDDEGAQGPKLLPNQAEWKIETSSVGGEHFRKKQPPPPAEQSRTLERLVREFHDTMFFRPGELGEVTKQYFTSGAADDLKNSKVGLPKDARTVRTLTRKARIGIDADGAKRAVAFVEIVAEGQTGKGDFHSATKSTLWMERDGSKWKVIAFDFKQGAAAKPKPHKKGDGGGPPERKKEPSGKQPGKERRKSQ